MCPRIIIYVPGFPGEAIPRDYDERRVLDEVVQVATQKNITIDILYYPGIRDGGQFSFKNSKEYTFKHIQRKIDEGYSITLIGHSWGGLISLLAADQLDIDRMILITPFIIKIEDPALSSVLNFYSNEYPSLITKESIETNKKEIVNNFKTLQDIFEKENTNHDIKIIANTEDEIVSINSLRHLFATFNYFKNRSNFTETQNDHNFSKGRNELIKWLNINV